MVLCIFPKIHVLLRPGRGKLTYPIFALHPVRHNASIVPMIVVAEIVPPTRIVCRWMRSANLVLLCMLIEAFALTVVCLLEAPLVDDFGASFNVGAVQLVMTVPAKVRCVAAPAVVAHEDIAAAKDGEEGENDTGEKHDVVIGKGFG